MEGLSLDVVRVVMDIAALLVLPILVWLLKTTLAHQHQLLSLEQKVNSEIFHRIAAMERKLDTFDNKIDSRMDRLESNLNAKIGIMTTILQKCAASLHTGDSDDEV